MGNAIARFAQVLDQNKNIYTLCRVDPDPDTSYLNSNMSKRNIITLPDPLLRRPSAPIERVDDELRVLIDDMLETMYDAPGIGLAAVQVAIPRRLIVMDEGKIVETGTHDELIKAKGIYASLWSRQTGGFLLGEKESENA